MSAASRSYPYERDLVRYLEQLIRDMDVKIRKNKERADAESRPKVLKLDDQRRLDGIKQQQAGEPTQASSVSADVLRTSSASTQQVCSRLRLTARMAGWLLPAERVLEVSWQQQHLT